jgi:hypothetical protein
MLRGLAKFEKAMTANKLRAFGLFVEDTFISNATVAMAVKMLPPDVQKDRQRRLIRAHDLSVKHEEVPQPLRDYDPHTSYGLTALIDKIEGEMNERRAYK